MSTEETAYAPNAIYANRALCHAYRAVAAWTTYIALSYLVPEDVILPSASGAWLLSEVSQIIRYVGKAPRAGSRDGRSLRLSLYEGAFLLIPKGVSK